jgi:phosphohistidine phosphatase
VSGTPPKGRQNCGYVPTRRALPGADDADLARACGHNGSVLPDADPRRLFLLRHAKASWNRPGDLDHDRPLAPRGERELAGVGATIDSHLKRRLDLVLASTATRTRATVEGVLPRLDAPREVRLRTELYLAGAERLLAALNGLPDEVRTVLVCAHNPGLHELSLALLADDAPAQLCAGLPTAGLVVIDTDECWAELAAGAGRLVAFSAPGRR